MLWHPKTLQFFAMYNVFFIFGRFSIAGRLPKWPKIPFQYPLALRHPKILEKCRKHHLILVSVRNRFWAPPRVMDSSGLCDLDLVKATNNNNNLVKKKEQGEIRNIRTRRIGTRTTRIATRKARGVRTIMVKVRRSIEVVSGASGILHVNVHKKWQGAWQMSYFKQEQEQQQEKNKNRKNMKNKNKKNT